MSGNNDLFFVLNWIWTNATDFYTLKEQKKLLVIITDQHDALSSSDANLNKDQSEQPGVPRFGCKCDYTASTETNASSPLCGTLKALPRFLSGYPSVIVQMMSSKVSIQ